MAHDPTTGNLPREGSGEQATRHVEGVTSDAAGASFEKPIRLDTIDSTNRYLGDLVREGAPEGTAVLAERQSAGRGRLGRRWADVGGGSVLCSVLFRPAIDMERWHLYTWLVCLAARDACLDVAGVETSVKWPNDLMAGERKVAGVLAEVVSAAVSGAPDDSAAPVPALVVGVGINCTWPPGWPPSDDPDAAEIARRATALNRVAGSGVDRDAVAARLLDRIAQRNTVLRSSPGAERALATELSRNLATIGRLVRVELAGESFEGMATGLDEQGRLLVSVGAAHRAVAAGDVVHLRS